MASARRVLIERCARAALQPLQPHARSVTSEAEKSRPAAGRLWLRVLRAREREELAFWRGADVTAGCGPPNFGSKRFRDDVERVYAAKEARQELERARAVHLKRLQELSSRAARGDAELRTFWEEAMRYDGTASRRGARAARRAESRQRSREEAAFEDEQFEEFFHDFARRSGGFGTSGSGTFGGGFASDTASPPAASPPCPHRDALGLCSGVLSTEAVKQAFRAAAMRLHPDRDSSEQAKVAFREAHAARDALLEQCSRLNEHARAV